MVEEEEQEQSPASSSSSSSCSWSSSSRRRRADDDNEEEEDDDEEDNSSSSDACYADQPANEKYDDSEASVTMDSDSSPDNDDVEHQYEDDEDQDEEQSAIDDPVVSEDDMPALDPSNPMFPKSMYMCDVLVSAAGNPMGRNDTARDEASHHHTARDQDAPSAAAGAGEGAPGAPGAPSASRGGEGDQHSKASPKTGPGAGAGVASLTLPASIKEALSTPVKRKRMVPLGSTLQGNSIGPAMHTGDDEGRAAAKRVRRPPPSPAPDAKDAEGDDNDDNGAQGAANNMAEQVPGHAHDPDADDDDDDEEEERAGKRRRNRPRRNPRTRSDAAAAAAAAATASSSSSRNGHGGSSSSSSHQARVRLSPCWLCTFSSTRVAKQITSFVSSNAGTMDPAIMADQIKRLILAKYPHAIGIGRMTVLRHLREHMLLPNVRMAGIVRSLITLAETLRCTLQQIDDDTGEVMIDIKNTELYLKVISQIHSVYRTDGSKMLFSLPGATTTGAPAASVSNAAMGAMAGSAAQHH